MACYGAWYLIHRVKKIFTMGNMWNIEQKMTRECKQKWVYKAEGWPSSSIDSLHPHRQHEVPGEWAVLVYDEREVSSCFHKQLYIIYIPIDVWEHEKLSCESKPHKGHLTSKLKCRQFPSYLLCILLLVPFHLLPTTVHPTGFCFCLFPGFLAIFILLSSNNNNNNGDVIGLICHRKISTVTSPHFLCVLYFFFRKG